MKRTTLKIETALLRRLKKQAADEGRSFQEVANRLLRKGLASEPRRDFRLTLTGWNATLQPGADILDRDKLFDLMDRR
jgi:plasmid stability protein